MLHLSTARMLNSLLELANLSTWYAYAKRVVSTQRAENRVTSDDAVDHHCGRDEIAAGQTSGWQITRSDPLVPSSEDSCLTYPEQLIGLTCFTPPGTRSSRSTIMPSPTPHSGTGTCSSILFPRLFLLSPSIYRIRIFPRPTYV